MGTRPVAVESVLWRLWLGTPVVLAVAALGVGLATWSPAAVVATAVVVLGGFAATRERVDSTRPEWTWPRRAVWTAVETAAVGAAGAILVWPFLLLVFAGGCVLGADGFCGPR